MSYRIIVSALLVLLSSTAHADNFRCPNGSIVSTGDSISVVATKCDPPSLVTRREETVESEHHKTTYIEVQEWFYNEGPDRLTHTLVFRNGTLDSVASGGYGK